MTGSGGKKFPPGGKTAVNFPPVSRVQNTVRESARGRLNHQFS